VELIRSFTAAQFSEGLESWPFLDLGGKRPLFASPFGDVFLEAPDAIWYLDTVEGSLSRVWASAEELWSALKTDEGQDRYLLAGLAAAVDSQGLSPGDSEVYGFKIAPVIGGQIDPANVEVTDFVVSLNILGQIHGQVRNLPPRTKISGFTVDGGELAH